ncbi:MAG: DNA-directed RNA polymerase subunit delta [Bacilli bacterium]|nr:DNA-directed RNA polymerase subunit delta [Bacilli bacterium]
MKLENLKKEELEQLSFTDLTEMILKESRNAMNTPSIFKKICSLLELSDEEYQSKIGDYYTSLTTDKRFIRLENAEWDLKDRHKVEILNFEDEEDEEDDTNIDDDILDDESLDTDDDLDDLSIIDDDEIDEES